MTVGFVIYRKLTFRNTFEVLKRCAILTASLTFTIAGAAVISWVAISEQIGPKLTQDLLSITNNPIFILFIINGILFVLVPLGVYFILGYLVFYHLRTYGLTGDSTKKTAYKFTAVLVLITVMIIITFLSIDWDAGSTEDFFSRSSQILNGENYEQ